MAHCMRHYEEPSVAECRTCGRPYCSRCVVYSFGKNQAPFCVGCALLASGVRNHGKKVPMHAAPVQAVDRRVLRAQRKAEKPQQKMLKAAMKGGGDQAPPSYPPPLSPHRSSEVPAPTGMTLPSSRFASHGASHGAN